MQPLNDVGILPRQERSSWGFIWPFVAHKMSLCVGFFTGQGARATQSRELPRDPDAWRLVTRVTSEALQKRRFPPLRKLLSAHGVPMTGFISMSYFHHSWSVSDKKNPNVMEDRSLLMAIMVSAVINTSCCSLNPDI